MPDKLGFLQMQKAVTQGRVPDVSGKLQTPGACAIDLMRLPGPGQKAGHLTTAMDKECLRQVRERHSIFGPI